MDYLSATEPNQSPQAADVWLHAEQGKLALTIATLEATFEARFEATVEATVEFSRTHQASYLSDPKTIRGDCKAALQAANGDVDLQRARLRWRGAKKSSSVSNPPALASRNIDAGIVVLGLSVRVL